MQALRQGVADTLRRFGRPLQLAYPAAVIQAVLMAVLAGFDRAGLLQPVFVFINRFNLPLPVLIGLLFIGIWSGLVLLHVSYAWERQAPWIEDSAEPRGGLLWWDLGLLVGCPALMLLSTRYFGFLTFDMLLVGALGIFAGVIGLSRAWTLRERFRVVQRLIYLDFIDDVEVPGTLELSLAQPYETFNLLAAQYERWGLSTRNALYQWNDDIHLPQAGLNAYGQPMSLIAGDELRIPRYQPALPIAPPEHDLPPATEAAPPAVGG